MLAGTTALPQLHPPPCQTTNDGKQLCDKATGFQMGILYLDLIALGTGGLKSSTSGFASDQFDEKDYKEAAQRPYFFSRLFFFISLGTLVAVTVLVYIQDEVGRCWGYGICSVSMAVAIAVFYSGRRRYRYEKCHGSPIVHILQVLAAAFEKRRLELPSDGSLLYEDSDASSRIQHTQQFGCLDKAAIVRDEEFEKHCSGLSTATGAMVNPWKLCTVTRVEEVKMMVRLLPIWATTIMFGTAYAQMITLSVEQATTMVRSIGGFQIPAGSLTVFFVAARLITLAAYDGLIMRLWKTWKGKPGFTNLQKMAIGLVLSLLGMVSADIVEKKRLSVARAIGRGGQAIPDTLPLTVFVLIPQFFFVGAGEAFIYTGQLDFFITQSPKGMKTMSTGLFLTTLSLGFFLSSFLVSVVKGISSGGGQGSGWLADDINYGRLYLFYTLLAILSFINYVVFMVCAIWYKPPMPMGSAGASFSRKEGDGSIEV